MIGSLYSDMSFIRSTFHVISRAVLRFEVQQRASDDVAALDGVHVFGISELVHYLKDHLLHLHGLADGSRSGIRPLLMALGNGVKIKQFVALIISVIETHSLWHSRVTRGASVKVSGGETDGN